MGSIPTAGIELATIHWERNHMGVGDANSRQAPIAPGLQIPLADRGWTIDVSDLLRY